MAMTNMQIMTWIDVGVVNQRSAIISDLSSDGLISLEHVTHDDAKDTCSSYAKRTDSPFPIILPPLAKQRIYSLVPLVQDVIRAEQIMELTLLMDRSLLVVGTLMNGNHNL